MRSTKLEHTLGPTFDFIRLLEDDGEEKVHIPVLRHGLPKTAYIARNGEDWFAVIDGVPGPGYESILDLYMSEDGSQAVYIARKGKKWVVVANGHESEEYDELASDQ